MTAPDIASTPALSPIVNAKKVQHPMIPVPQALRTVLQQSATTLVNRSKSKSKSNSKSKSTETISLESSAIPNLVGRISSETIYASEEGYPPYHASIMDGYAINTNDVQMDYVNDNSTIKRFQIVNRIHAGKTTTLEEKDSNSNSNSNSNSKNILQNDNLPKAIYVTTGAVIPYQNYNTVIPLEQVNEYISNQVIAIDLHILHNVKPDMWIRTIGCDIRPKSIILKKGCRIDPVHVGLLLQCGILEVKVQKRPIVGILSTGNEILSFEEMKQMKLSSSSSSSSSTSLGMIPDANGPVLTSLLTSYQSCQIINYGIVNDDNVDNLTKTIHKAIQGCDVLITSGGVSMGEKDIIKEVLYEKLGCQIHFGRLNMKPGKPTTFATTTTTTKSNYNEKETCLIFAMPGNPVSAYVCTELLVRPCLDLLHETIIDALYDNNNDMGNDNDYGNENDDGKDNNILSIVQNANVHAEIYATLIHSVKLDTERPEYLRVTLSTEVILTDSGENRIRFLASPTGVQRSSRLMSMCHADGLMMMPQGERDIKIFTEEGDSFPVLLLRRPGGDTLGRSFLNTIKLKDSLHFQNSSLTVGILEIVGEGGNGITSSNSDGIIDDDDDDDFDYNDVKSRIVDVFDDDSILYLQSIQITTADSISKTIRSVMSNCLDIILVVCTQTSFLKNLEISEEMRHFVTKEAKSISFQARRGAAYDSPLSALFEPVAGYCDLDGKSCMLLSLPNEGMENGLDSVQALLRKGVSVAGGKRAGNN